MKRILFFILFSLNVFAETPSTFTQLFQAEQFEDAIDSLEKIPLKEITPSKKEYLIGLCHSRMRNYEQAIVHFKNVLKSSTYESDLHYEYGQALFALNKLKEARYEFTKSAGKKINYTPSIYYAAYISELLEDFIMAKFYYGKLIKDDKTDKKFLQIAYYQYAQVLLKMMRNRSGTFKTVDGELIRLDTDLINYIPRYIQPLLQKAIETDQTSALALEIEQFKLKLLDEFKLDPNILANGRRMSPQKTYANIAHRLKYDSNVELTQLASVLNETEGYIKHDHIFNKRFVSSPELRLNYLSYNDQNNSQIYQYDAFSYAAAVRNKLEHVYHGLPASLLLDIEYSSLDKDWNQTHKREYYSRTYSWVIGEQFSYFKSGETYLKIRNSDYTDQSGTANYRMLGLSADQYIFINEGRQLLIASFYFSQLNYYENSLLSNDTYMARFLYLNFDIIPSYTLQLTLSSTLTDTKEQKSNRGYEVNVSPGIDIFTEIFKNLKLSINYNYTNNSSKDTSYKYSRQIMGTELSYTF